MHMVLYVLFIPLYFALHVSDAIRTDPQEHKLQSTAIGMCNVYGMSIHWSKYWLGHSEGVPASTCSSGLTYHKHYTHL
jgi:hypothetical protein